MSYNKHVTISDPNPEIVVTNCRDNPVQPAVQSDNPVVNNSEAKNQVGDNTENNMHEKMPYHEEIDMSSAADHFKDTDKLIDPVIEVPSIGFRSRSINSLDSGHGESNLLILETTKYDDKIVEHKKYELIVLFLYFINHPFPFVCPSPFQKCAIPQRKLTIWRLID